MNDNQPHTTLTFALDIVDKLIKLVAVAIGGWWTWWNYRKSRTYQPKLELELTVFLKSDLYGDVRLTVKNIGESMQAVEPAATFCELLIVRDDLSEEGAALFPVFANRRRIEPGEAVVDTFCWCITAPLDGILWVKLELRIVTGGVEW
jgi:hypothetical protein